MNSQITKTFTSSLLALCVCLLPFFSITASAAQDASLHFVRTIENENLFSVEFFNAGPPDLSGVGFPPGAHSLLMFDRSSGATDLVLAAPPKHSNDKVERTLLPLADSINIAFDPVSVGAKGQSLARLFAWDSASGNLITIGSTARNVMDKNRIKRFNIFTLGVDNPQGLTLNPYTGQLFVLDVDNARIVAVQPKPGHVFADVETTSITLPKGLGMLRGLAFNPADQHFYVLSTPSQTLYKLTLQGELVARLAIADEILAEPQGLVFAPSLDPTDDSSVYHLYVATKTGVRGEISEWELPGPF